MYSDTAMSSERQNCSDTWVEMSTLGKCSARDEVRLNANASRLKLGIVTNGPPGAVTKNSGLDVQVPIFSKVSVSFPIAECTSL